MGLAIGLVILIALVITGFVAPGFFLSKDSNTSAGPGAAPGNGNPATPPGAQAVAKQLVDVVNKVVPGKEDLAFGEFDLMCPSVMSGDETSIVKAINGLTKLNAVGEGAQFALRQSEADPNNPQGTLFNVDSTNKQPQVSTVLNITKEGDTFCAISFRG